MLAEVILQTVVERSLIAAASVQTVRESMDSRLTTGLGADEAVLGHLYATGQLSRDAVLTALSERFAIPAVDAADCTPTSEARELLSAERARSWQVLPLSVSAGEIIVAVANPLEWPAVDHWAQSFGRSVDPRLADAEALRRAIDDIYGQGTYWPAGEVEPWGSAKDEEASSLQVSEADGPTSMDGASVDAAPIVRYVQKLIGEGLRQRASDIHLEPMERRFRVRFRIDGRLREVENPPQSLQASIASRVKLMAGISIAEKRLPQDGRMRLQMGGKVVDFRVSSLPSIFGESIVLRILDPADLRPGLADLGFAPAHGAGFERVIAQPDGLILVTGPTGSGKSTTLYATLHHLNECARKIITVEDPIEQQLSGVNQVQVRREIGMDFAAALRAMLRQAPNIIMVGEIRDRETAEIAMNASLTGHLVFSTLHTNDAVGAVSRLVDIGVKPFLVASSLRGVLAQRLVRRSCAECRTPYTPLDEEIRALGLSLSDARQTQFFRGGGCAHCAGIGYRGRLAIFEWLEVDPDLASLIYQRASIGDLRKRAREQGLPSLREDGSRKVLAGLTTSDEVLAVTVGEGN